MPDFSQVSLRRPWNRTTASDGEVTRVSGGTDDFVPGGALPVPEGDAIVPLANELQSCFGLVVATQDWHPPDHGSFAANHPGKRVYDVTDLHGLPR